MFAIVNESEIVGMILLYEHSKSVVRFGIEVFETYRRKGYANEAISHALVLARNKGYKIMSVQIRVDNVANIALHQKAGFETDFYEYVNRKVGSIFIRHIQQPHNSEKGEFLFSRMFDICIDRI